MKLKVGDVIGMVVLDVGTTNLTIAVGETLRAVVWYPPKKSTIHFEIQNPDMQYSLRTGKLKRIRKNPYGPTVYRMAVYGDDGLPFERPLVAIRRLER